MSNPAPQPTPLTPQERYTVVLTELRPRHRRFVEEFLLDLHQRNAAIRAGYAEASADSQASELRRNPKIAQAIEAGLEAQAMPASEVLARMVRIARSSIADVLRLPPADAAAAATTPERPPLVGTAADSWTIDLIKAQRTGAIHLVRKIKEGEHGPEIELYSAYDALVKLGEHYKLWGKSADLLKLIDLSKLSDDQLGRLAEGEDPIKVLLG